MEAALIGVVGVLAGVLFTELIAGRRVVQAFWREVW
jgi:hypothetical protein